MKTRTKKPFMSAFARFKVNQVVKVNYDEDLPLYQIKFRFMDIDDGSIVYLCVSKDGHQESFTQSQLEAVDAK